MRDKEEEEEEDAKKTSRRLRTEPVTMWHELTVVLQN